MLCISESNHSLETLILFFLFVLSLPVVMVRIGNSTEMMVEEGGSLTLCAEIESPVSTLIERRIFILGSLLSGTAEGMSFR